ncbi:PRC-barrel domain-containing protein [Streptomyces sp. NPDC003717]|uniref:PRC-barrel domain-containing protein n=1 Tax=Streptomyces sp. NPDC003717 TaxID=3154276 RepID=UPI0033B333F2
MLFTEVRGLPVVSADGGGRLGTVTSLVLDAAAGRVGHVRVRGGLLRRETVLGWDAVRSAGPAGLLVSPAARAEDPAPGARDLLESRVLTEAGHADGVVLDAAFDPGTGRLLAVFTTRGEVAPDRLLGLGDHALVVRAD